MDRGDQQAVVAMAKTRWATVMVGVAPDAKSRPT
jgi:hypothetical protein